MWAGQTTADVLGRSIRSVLSQTFSDFELIIVDDGSEVGQIGERFGEDSRLRVVPPPAESGNVASFNAGLAAAAGKFVAAFDHHSLPCPRALAVCSDILYDNPECDIVYTDEEWVDGDGAPQGLVLKPDWSPERLRAQDYLSPAVLYRKRLLDELGGMRSGFTGCEDYDLVLRATEQARQIIHIPEILYQRWPLQNVDRTSIDGAPKTMARTAIQEHLDRVGIDGEVEAIDPEGVYRIHRHIPQEPLVSIVLPSRGESGMVRGTSRTYVIEAARSIITTSSYATLELVVVVDSATPRGVVDALAELGDRRVRLLRYGAPFNHSHACNLGVASAAGDYVLLLSEKVEVISPHWIDSMLGLLEQPGVGMVGAALFLEDGTLQHGGYRYCRNVVSHIGYGADGNDSGPLSAFRTERECSGVSAACTMLHRRDYLDLGGLCLSLPFHFSDVDLSLKVRSSGERIIWTPSARLYHFEPGTREVGAGRTQGDLVWRRWGHILEGIDPYWRYPDSLSKSAVDSRQAIR
jgi:glycosyltransferase involved in cell wall biosynthesis